MSDPDLAVPMPVLEPSDEEKRAVEEALARAVRYGKQVLARFEQPQLAFSEPESSPAPPTFLSRANAAEQLKIQAEIDRLRASAPQKPETETLAKMTFVPLNPAPRDLQAENDEALRRVKTELGHRPSATCSSGRSSDLRPELEKSTVRIRRLGRGTVPS